MEALTKKFVGWQEFRKLSKTGGLIKNYSLLKNWAEKSLMSFDNEFIWT